MHKKILICVGITFLFLGTCTIPSVAIDNPLRSISNGNTLYVGGSGEGNYTTIQKAINDAEDGDTVFVYDDKHVYYENLVIKKSINLIGENKDTTVIDGEELGNVIELYNDSIWIENFTIRDSKKESDILTYSGIYCFSNYNTITNCIFYDNRYGITLSGNRNNIINNLITENVVGIGIEGSNNFISMNIITKNKQWGILLNHCMYNNITFNHIGFNDFGIRNLYSNGITIERNNFILNRNPAYYWCNVEPDNIFEGNYWNRPRILPKMIFGLKYFETGVWVWPYFWFPDFEIDRHPAKVPYNI